MMSLNISANEGDRKGPQGSTPEEKARTCNLCVKKYYKAKCNQKMKTETDILKEEIREKGNLGSLTVKEEGKGAMI